MSRTFFLHAAKRQWVAQQDTYTLGDVVATRSRNYGRITGRPKVGVILYEGAEVYIHAKVKGQKVATG